MSLPKAELVLFYFTFLLLLHLIIICLYNKIKSKFKIYAVMYMQLHGNMIIIFSRMIKSKRSHFLFLGNQVIYLCLKITIKGKININTYFFHS